MGARDWKPGSKSQVCSYCSATLGKLPNLSEPPIAHAHSGKPQHRPAKPLKATWPVGSPPGKASIMELGTPPSLLRPGKDLWEEGAKVLSHQAGKAGLGESSGGPRSRWEVWGQPRNPGSSHAGPAFPACPLQGEARAGRGPPGLVTGPPWHRWAWV